MKQKDRNKGRRKQLRIKGGQFSLFTFLLRKRGEKEESLEENKEEQKKTDVKMFPIKEREERQKKANI